MKQSYNGAYEELPAIAYMMGMDTLEKLKIIENECDNLVSNLKYISQKFRLEKK